LQSKLPGELKGKLPTAKQLTDIVRAEMEGGKRAPLSISLRQLLWLRKLFRFLGKHLVNDHIHLYVKIIADRRVRGAAKLQRHPDLSIRKRTTWTTVRLPDENTGIMRSG
jgi:hypothetical protein